MLTIITPCSRPENLPYIYDSINFDKIEKWIIIYDTTKCINQNKLYETNSKILEVKCKKSMTGNPQRNYGMRLVDDGFMYFLDDDNIIHPNFWNIIESLDDNNFYTFHQLRDNKEVVLPGNNIMVGYIDTAMFIVHKKHTKNIYWKHIKNCADGFFICDVNKNHEACHIYIDSVGCYYNYLHKPE
jgi:hypothetical protein